MAPNWKPCGNCNALVLSADTGLTSGTLTLVTPATYASIAVLAHSGNGTNYTGTVNGAGVFMYVDGHKDVPVTVDIRAPRGWKIATGLEKRGRSYAAPNRGSRSVQHGTQLTLPKLRSTGTNGVAGADRGGTKLLK